MPIARHLFLIYLFLLPPALLADVVKPALIEISVHTDGRVVVDMRVSLEALLTGINARYKNTQDAPTAEKYDVYRKQSSVELSQSFTSFEQKLLDSITLKVDSKPVVLSIDEISVPERGYTKIPRISQVTLKGSISTDSKTLQWHYPEMFGDNAVRVRQVDEVNERWHWSQWQWLRNDESSTPFSLQEMFTRPPLLETIWSYMVVGFEHIVPKGSDHILFILGLFLFSVRMKPLLWQVTMFTIAHTITLGLSMNGVIALPAIVVEPLIALSIAYVGIENILAKRLHKSRLFLVFGFGLLHGLGFASMLNDFGMPESDFATALISFNVGVELGQLAVITLAFFAVGLWFRKRDWYRNRIIIPASFGISITGLFWTVDRLAIF